MATAALYISLVCDVVAALLLANLVRSGFGRTAAVWSAALFLSYFDFLSLARSGMETSFFVVLVAATLDRMANRSWGWVAVLAALAALARPEGLILVALIPLSLYVDRREAHRRSVLTVAAILIALLGT